MSIEDGIAARGELYAALAAARLEFADVVKSKTAQIKSDKGSYGYSYADLSALIEATAAPMAKHGLSLIQEPEVIQDNGRMVVVVHGAIVHKGGGVYQLRPLPLPVAQTTPQGIGSAISYARRYQMQAALNLAAEDDDGKEASKAQARPQAQPAQATPQGKTLERASEARLKRLHSVGTEAYGAEWDDKRHKLVETITHGASTSSNDLTPKECDDLIAGIEKKLTAQVADKFDGDAAQRGAKPQAKPTAGQRMAARMQVA